MVCISECDIPVPGIPGPGNFAPFWMVPVPVSEKIGPGTVELPGTPGHFIF